MVGRAGRPGFDSFGTAVVMTDNRSKEKYHKLAISGLTAAQSCLMVKRDEIINTAVVQTEITSMKSAVDWLKQSLYFVQLSRQKCGQQTLIDQDLHLVIQEALANLTNIGAVRQLEDGSIKSTPTGIIMSNSLVAFQGMELITRVPHHGTPRIILETIAQMDGLQRPVRRQEKRILNQTQ